MCVGVHLHEHHVPVCDAGDLRAGPVLAQPMGGAAQLHQGPRGVHQPGQLTQQFTSKQTGSFGQLLLSCD